MAHFVNYNGKVFNEDTPIASAGNRGLRYGDGVFETMRVVDSEIRLESYHFERLFRSLDLLQFEIPTYFTPAYLKEQIRNLCLKNNLKNAARVRMNVFRKNGGLYDAVDRNPDFVIEAWQLRENYLQFNNDGISLGVYKDAQKSCDSFSSIKSNNFLHYAMAAFYTRQHSLNDSLILNTYGRICDSTIANVFCVSHEVIFTPPLAEGCIDGVMRRHLLKVLPQYGYTIQEKSLEIDDLLQADEIFLTNAISVIRWVNEFQGRHYLKTLSSSIYPLLI